MSGLTITVAAGPHDRRFAPLKVVVDTPTGATFAELLPAGLREKDIPPPAIVAQIDPTDGGKAEMTFIVPWLKQNSSITYDVVFKEGSAPAGVALKQDGDDVDISILGETLGRYYTDTDKFMRPFIHPVMGPFGHSVTRGAPVEPRPGETEDHSHHKSLWVAHGDTNGTDNWHVGGIQKQKEVIRCNSGAVYGVLETTNEWISIEGRKDCEDHRTWTFWALPNGQRFIDLDIDLIATEGDLELGDTKEGGIMSIRVATVMDVPRTGRIRNAEGGVDEDETWGKRSAWCDYSGLDEGGNAVGVTIMNSPNSFRYPTYWHVRNYGLMTANPFGLSHFYENSPIDADGTHVVPAGEKISFGYRLYVHAGDADGGHVADMFHSYIAPAKVTVK